jgi:RNA polymerase sigma-70 factor, ECF subfamily
MTIAAQLTLRPWATLHLRWAAVNVEARDEGGKGTFRRQAGSASERLSARAERACIRGAQRGSEEAIETLFRHYWAIGYRTAAYVTRDPAAAEDIAQEAFVAAVRKLDRFDRRRPFGPWFKRLVANRAIDWTRARKLRRESPAGAEPSRDLLGDATEGAGVEVAETLSGELMRALGGLDVERRTVVVLRYLLEYTPGEIAELLGVPRGTVNSRLRRALDQLQGELGGEE